MEGPRRAGKHRRLREAAPTRYAAPAEAQPVAGVLLDSDVVIEVLRGRKPVVERLLALETSGVPTYCCALTWAEIVAGLRPGEESLTEAFLEARGDVAIDAAAGRRAGAYLARYSRSHGVEIADALVAAAAATTGLSLWTLNRRHYPMGDVVFHV
jgi:predicted nucleic acid-binding protein